MSSELKEREPVDVREMDKKRWEGHHSICQMLRDIYHLTDNEELRLKARVAMAMTKAMHERLKKYKAEKEVSSYVSSHFTSPEDRNGNSQKSSIETLQEKQRFT